MVPSSDSSRSSQVSLWSLSVLAMISISWLKLAEGLGWLPASGSSSQGSPKSARHLARSLSREVSLGAWLKALEESL